MKHLVFAALLSAFGLVGLGPQASAGRYLDPIPRRGAPRSPEEVVLRDVPRSHYNSNDQWRVAQLGPNWAKMVRPRDPDIEPYPVCKKWKTWINPYGIRVTGWEWSELNCPWRQCRNCDDD